MRAVADAVEDLDEVEYVVITAGRFDLLVEVVCTDTQPPARAWSTTTSGPSPACSATEVFTYLSLVKQTYSWGVR